MVCLVGTLREFLESLLRKVGTLSQQIEETEVQTFRSDVESCLFIFVLFSGLKQDIYTKSLGKESHLQT